MRSVHSFVAASLFILAASKSGSWAICQAAESTPAPGPKHTSLERMMPPHLKAAHADVERFKQQRRSLPLPPGLHDYRAILHAHAEDSAHTGGTRPEMLADARKSGVSAILLTDHFRPPRDFIKDSWRGLRDGVLFIPGSEARGFLIYPAGSIVDKMEAATPEFIPAVSAGEGLIFLSHIEERPEHPMDGLNGMEIYNRHADAKRDTAFLVALAMKLTEPRELAELEESLRLYPDELLAAQVEYPQVYLQKWDGESQKRRLTGVAANDCHHNQILVVKKVDDESVRIGTNVDPDDKMRVLTAGFRPGIRELTKNRKPGEVLARLDFDPYFRSFRNVSTHLLAPELSEKAIRAALRSGHAYVSHDWMCDPTGFMFEAIAKEAAGRADASDSGDSARKLPQLAAHALMGDELSFIHGLTLVARVSLPSKLRLLKNGKVIAEQAAAKLEQGVEGPGVYRLEAWLTVDGEDRPWIYSNPIYVR